MSWKLPKKLADPRFPSDDVPRHCMHESGIAPLCLLGSRPTAGEESPTVARVICDACQSPLPLILLRPVGWSAAVGFFRHRCSS